MSIRGTTNLARLTAIVALCVVAATVLYFYSSSQAQHQRDAEKVGKDRLNKLPVAEIDVPESFDAHKRANRQIKNKAYNSTFSGGRRNAKLTAEIGATRSEWDLGLESNIPVAQSSAVVVAEVVDAKAYLSEDKTEVYSEFTVRVSEVIKNDTNEPVAIEDLLAVDRLGGRVRQASGQLGSFYVSGQGTPEVGNRYVFFLGFNPREARGVADTQSMNRHILTAYELRAGKVFPLDSSGAQNFEDFNAVDEAKFLDEIKRSLTTP